MSTNIGQLWSESGPTPTKCGPILTDDGPALVGITESGTCLAPELGFDRLGASPDRHRPILAQTRPDLCRWARPGLRPRWTCVWVAFDVCGMPPRRRSDCYFVNDAAQRLGEWGRGGLTESWGGCSVGCVFGRSSQKIVDCGGRPLPARRSICRTVTRTWLRRARSWTLFSFSGAGFGRRAGASSLGVAANIRPEKAGKRMKSEPCATVLGRTCG